MTLLIDWLNCSDRFLPKSITSAFNSFLFFLYVSFWLEKQNLQQRERRGIFPVGLCHCTSGSDQGARETCQPGWRTPSGARWAGGVRGSLRSLSVSPFTLVSPFYFVSFILFCLSLSDTSFWLNRKLWAFVDANKFIREMAGEQVELSQRRKFCLLFHLLSCLSIHLFISLLSSRMPGCSEGLVS